MGARGVLGLIAVTALMGSAACGSVSAGSAGQTASASASSSAEPTAATGSPAGQSLCASGQGADRVVLTRTMPRRQVTLSGATQVQAMVAALCALPAMPSGQHCLVVPADVVRLVFAAGEQSFPPVTVQEAGCRGITGLGTTRSWVPSSVFGRLLSEAVGGSGKLAPGTHPSSVPTGP
ncbi:MAG TPA: hypothetical protein VKU77_26235 [Streptosporangiaceae bacterium]|nr:hypothetical protein [Streptosporangiaceae bacterium]